jgi:hypothetical protein
MSVLNNARGISAAAAIAAIAAAGAAAGCSSSGSAAPAAAKAPAGARTATARAPGSAAPQASSTGNFPAGPLLVVNPDAVPGPADYGEIEPTAIGITSDINSQLRNLHWTTWNNQGAAGQGDEAEDNCVPSCAQGTLKWVHMTITLGVTRGGAYTLMT